MSRLIIEQLAKIVLTLWLALTLSFFVLRLLPGNAISAQLSGSGLPQSVIDQRIAQFRYDQPLISQYGWFLSDLLSGNLGQSLYTGQTVSAAITSRMDDTVLLAGWSLLLAIIFGIAFGLLASTSTALKYVAKLIIDLAIGIPIYVTATIALFVVAARIGGIQRGLLLPVIVLGFHSSGAIARIIETKITEIRTTNYIRTAYAKGLSSRVIFMRHMLKIALVPAITVIGLQAGILFSGTVITETIFGRPGLGLLLLDATLQRDYPIVQGVVMLSALIYVLANAIATSIIFALDPTRSQQ